MSAEALRYRLTNTHTTPYPINMTCPFEDSLIGSRQRATVWTQLPRQRSFNHIIYTFVKSTNADASLWNRKTTTCRSYTHIPARHIVKYGSAVCHVFYAEAWTTQSIGRSSLWVLWWIEYRERAHSRRWRWRRSLYKHHHSTHHLKPFIYLCSHRCLAHIRVVKYLGEHRTATDWLMLMGLISAMDVFSRWMHVKSVDKCSRTF